LFEKIAADPRFEIAALVVDGRIVERHPRTLVEKLKDPRTPAAVMRRMCQAFDTRFAGADPQPATPAFDALLVDLPRVIVSPEQRRFVDQFGEADSAAVADLSLDVLLRHAFGIIKGPILSAARHGIWSFHHGDNRVNRGGPAGFWEAARREPTTGATLQILTPELDGGRVIARCAQNTLSNAVRNQRAIFHLSVSLIWRELQRLHRDGWIESEPPVVYDGPLYVEPTARDSARYLVQRIGDVAQGQLHNLRRRLGRRPGLWSLAVGRGDFTEAALWRTREVPSPPRRFWADPFLIERNGTTYVLFEDYDYDLGRGYISAGRLEGDTIEYLGVAIDAGYHMSFPFVFIHGDDVFMIPETAEKRRVEVWRAVDFPLRWELHRTALEGTAIADATLFQHDGRWWLLGNVSQTPHTDHCNELHVFMVDGPDLRDVRPHPLNPVVVDASTARNAGRPFVSNGRLHRPSQFNARSIYGRGLNLMEITELTETTYAERLVIRLEPNFRPGLSAMHHVDQVGDRFIIDVCRAKGG
jgi:hypothetical protein